MEECNFEHKQGSFRAYFECLQTNKHFRLLWIAETIDNVGSWLNYVATLTLVQKFSGSSLAISAVVLIRFLPSLLLAPICGVVADRCNRMRVLQCAALMDAAVVAALALVQHPSQVWLLYLLLAAQFACISFYEPARKAMIPVVVPQPQLHLATTIDSFAWSITGAVGASVGGVLASKLGNATCFLVDSLTYLVAAWCAYQLPLALGQPGASRGSCPPLDIPPSPAASRAAREPYLGKVPRPGTQQGLAGAEAHVELIPVGVGGGADAEEEAAAAAVAEGGLQPGAPGSSLPTSAGGDSGEVPAVPAVHAAHAAAAGPVVEGGCGEMWVLSSGGGGRGGGDPQATGHLHAEHVGRRHGRVELPQGEMDVEEAARGVAAAAGECSTQHKHRHQLNWKDGEGLSRKDSDPLGCPSLPTFPPPHPQPGGADTGQGERAPAAHAGPTGMLPAAVVAVREAVRMAWWGWRYVSCRENRDVAAMVSMKCCGSLVWGAVDVLNVRFSQMPSMQRFGDASVTLGLIFAAVGLGCFLGPIALNTVIAPSPRSLAWGVAAAFGFLFGSFLLMLVAPGVLLVLLSTLVRSVGSACIWIYSTLLIQMRVPNAVLGRMSAVESALYTVTEAGSSLFGGAAFDVLGLSLHQAIMVLTVVAAVMLGVWASFAAGYQRWGGGDSSWVKGGEYRAVATTDDNAV